MTEIIPKIKSVLDSCKITEEKLQVCQKEKSEKYLENSKIKQYVAEKLVAKYNKEECKDSCYTADFQECIDDLLLNQESDAFGVYE